jgi:flagellar biogenesis protein FliO
VTRHLRAGVIALTLAVTGPALADDSHGGAPTVAAETPAAATKPAASASVKAVAPPAVKDPTPPSSAKAAEVPALAKDSPLAREISAALTLPSAPVAAAPAPPKAPVVARVAPSPAATTVAAVPPAAPAAAAPAPAPVAAAAAAAAAPAAAVRAPESAGNAEPPAELPLALRPPKPLVLANESPPLPWPYKLGFFAAVGAAGFLVWKKRRAFAAANGGEAAKKKKTAVRVIGKTSIGLRGELAVVEVGGMRLLVGVTPSSMQTLAVLADDEASEEELDASRLAPPPLPALTARDGRSSVPSAAERSASNRPSQLAARARSLFSHVDMGPPVPARVASGATFSASRYADESDIEADDEDRERERATRAARPSRPSREPAPLEGQARGIALAMSNRR